MWKKVLERLPGATASLLLAAGLLAGSLAVRAQDSAQPAVKWELQVMQDGTQVDSFSNTTTVGQSYSSTHRRSITHDVGCQNQPAAHIELSRTITVSPSHLDHGSITLALDAQETLEENGTPRTVEGCKLPPQPRQINASHPGLSVPDGQWASWQILDKNPALSYRVRASVVRPAGDAGAQSQ
jgi:hypothetical protein